MNEEIKGKPAEELYDDKEFFEIVDGKEVGPILGIRECAPKTPFNINQESAEIYKYCQVIDGIIVAAFKESEIILKKKVH